MRKLLQSPREEYLGRLPLPFDFGGESNTSVRATGEDIGVPYTDDPAVAVTLTGDLDDSGYAALSWDEYQGGDLKWYKIVHTGLCQPPNPV